MNKIMRGILLAGGVLILLLAGMVYLRSGGNVVVRGLPMSEPPAPAGPFEFRVIMYNVQSRPYFDDVKEKLPKISPLLNGFDIVGIEECFKEHELLWGGANYPNKVHFGSLVRPWKITNSGLATMTRLPMGEVLFEHYPNNLGELQNRVASKGIMLARLDAGGYPLDFYLTHMEAGGTAEAQVSRMAQAKQVVDFVSRNSPPEHAVLLCGDFNMMPLRKEKSPKEYSPGHFDSEADLHGRTAAFMVMYDGLGLRDASDELFGPTKDDIERYLFRAPKGVNMSALSLEVDSNTFRREDGSQLSDGVPFIAKFRIAP